MLARRSRARSLLARSYVARALRSCVTQVLARRSRRSRVARAFVCSERSGASLEPSLWSFLVLSKTFWGSLGFSGAFLGPLWGLSGAFWGSLGGALLNYLGPLWSSLGRLLPTSLTPALPRS
eukprot:4806791-Karenia_brevis.AAC.1